MDTWEHARSFGLWGTLVGAGLGLVATGGTAALATLVSRGRARPKPRRASAPQVSAWPVLTMAISAAIVLGGLLGYITGIVAYYVWDVMWQFGEAQRLGG